MSMEAIQFDHIRDYETYCAWLSGHKRQILAHRFLPRFGRIVPGYCAVFLYQTDSSVGFLENLASNPEVSGSPELDRALDCCLEAIQNDAKHLGVDLLVSSTMIPAVVARVERLGFSAHPERYRQITKELS